MRITFIDNWKPSSLSSFVKLFLPTEYLGYCKKHDWHLLLHSALLNHFLPQIRSLKRWARHFSWLNWKELQLYITSLQNYIGIYLIGGTENVIELNRVLQIYIRQILQPIRFKCQWGLSYLWICKSGKMYRINKTSYYSNWENINESTYRVGLKTKLSIHETWEEENDCYMSQIENNERYKWGWNKITLSI